MHVLDGRLEKTIKMKAGEHAGIEQAIGKRARSALLPHSGSFNQ